MMDTSPTTPAADSPAPAAEPLTLESVFAQMREAADTDAPADAPADEPSTPSALSYGDFTPPAPAVDVEAIRAQMREQVLAEHAEQARQFQAAEAARQAAESEAAQQAQLVRDMAVLLNPEASWDDQQEARQRSGPVFEQIRRQRELVPVVQQARNAALLEVFSDFDRHLRDLGVDEVVIRQAMQAPTTKDFAAALVGARRAQPPRPAATSPGRASSARSAPPKSTPAEEPVIRSLQDAFRVAKAALEAA